MRLFIACIDGNGVTGNRFLGVFSSEEKAKQACRDFDPEIDENGVESWVMPLELNRSVEWIIEHDLLNP